MSEVEALLRIRRTGFALDLPLTVASGEVVALLGPNGAGKTTALRALAGLSPLDEGHVRIGGRVLDDPPLFVAPEHRRIGVVFQDYLLFPHHTALENVAFGPRSRGVGKAEARERAAGLLAGLGVPADRRPRQLSGGQAQRVALARALAADPELLLLDEPLAALDAQTRLSVRSELRRQLAAFGGSAVVVTHDPLDALVLADRVVVVENGVAVQSGSPQEVARRPRTPYVARLAGLNLLRGVAEGHRVRVGAAVVVAAGEATGDVFVAFRPSAVAVYRARPDGSPRNVWPGTVTLAEPVGDAYRLLVEGEIPVTAEVSAAAVADLDLVEGRQVWVSVKAAEVESYPA
ncbi:MAG: transporter ATP-binding protein [Actinomycetia bacterium]|nr:transporter ATP-binding protein [Actinomycetes bacterium]